MYSADFNDVRDGHVFSRFQFVSKITKVLSNSGNEVINGVFQSRFQNIGKEIIKNVVASQFFLKFNKKALSLFNTSLSVGLGLSHQFINSSLNLFQSSLHNRSGFSNLSINNFLQVFKEINNVGFYSSRYNLVFEFIENVFDVLSNFHDISDSHVFNIFTRQKFSNKLSQMLLDGGDEVLNGFSKRRLQDIGKEIIKDVVSSKLVFKFSQFSHDLLQKLNKNTFSLFNSCFNIGFDLGNHFINSSLNLNQCFLNNRSGVNNFGINNFLQMFEEVNDTSFYLSRLNLGFEFIEDIFNVLGNFHDVRDGHVFSRLQFVSKITKMLGNSRNEVINGIFQSRFQNIGKEIIKNVVSSQFILEFSQFGHDLFQKFNKKALSLFNTSFSIGLGLSHQFINSSLNLFQSSLHNRSGFSNLSINNFLQVFKEINNVGFYSSRYNLVFEFIENVFDVLSNFHDISDSHVFNIFTRQKFSNKLSQMLLDGGDEVFNGFSKSRLQDIGKEIIKDVVSSKLVFKFSQFC